MAKRMPLPVLFIVLVVLTGCASRAVLRVDGKVPVATQSDVVPIYLATTRARSDDFGLPYSAERSQTLSFATFGIGIPEMHVRGRVETGGGRPDPARHFTARTYHPFDERAQFVRELDAALMERRPENREIFIFVHGYNNNIADSVFRNAQIVHDYNLTAVPLHYAWPSGGALRLYVFDRDSALVGRRGLAETIEIAAQTKARRIVLVGHSMGAYVVMEALRDLALTGRGRYLRRLNGVILAAPDIDVDVFAAQVKDIAELPQPFTIVVSRRDRALGLSRRIAGGHPRVGSGSDIVALQKKGIAVVDASEIDGGDHTVFASSQTLMKVVGDGNLLRDILEGEQSGPSETVFSSSASVIEGAASLVIYLPTRILGGLSQAGM